MKTAMVDLHPLRESRALTYCRCLGLTDFLVVRDLREVPCGEGPILFWFLLHRFSLADGAGVIRQSLQRGQAVAVVDYKLPERNLDFPAFWLGKLLECIGTHRKAYAQFMRSGGIEGLVRDVEKFPVGRDVLWGGGVGFIYWL